MPIKFRCRHCQQMLGISRSRAGATVDCPGCGRSVQVPADDDRDSSAADEPGSQPDNPSFRAALAELSALLEASAASSQIQRENRSVDSMRIVPLSAARGTANDPQVADLDSDPHTEAAQNTQRPSRWVRSPAPETADTSAVPGSALPSELSAVGPSPRAALEPTTSARPRSLTGQCALLLSAFALGAVSAGVAFSIWPGSLSAFRNIPGLAESAPESGAPVSADGTEISKDAADVSRVLSQSTPDNQQQNSPGLVTGSVNWVDAQGEQKVDAGALVLLLPSAHPGQLRLDGTSLRNIEPTADLRALEAALQELGVRFTRTDESGAFRLIRSTTDEIQLVVVSRFRARSPDEQIPSAASECLSKYFVAPAQFVGRLAILHQTLSPLTTAQPDPAEPLHLVIR